MGSTPAGAPCLRAPFSDAAFFPCRAADGAADTLHSLLVAARAGPAAPAVGRLTQSLDALVAELVAPAGLLPDSAAEAHGGAPPRERPSPTCRVYPGLLSPRGEVAAAVLAEVEAYYETAVLPGADIDERLSLLAVLGPPAGASAAAPAPAAAASAQPAQHAQHQRALQPLCSPAAPLAPGAAPAPARSGLPPLPPGASTSPAAPASEASQAAAWMRAVAEQHGHAPAAALVAALPHVDASEARRVAAVAEHLAATAWSPDGGGLQGTGAAAPAGPASPRGQALALFHRSLQLLLGSELARPAAGPPAVARLLSSECFLRGVMACAVECAAAAHQIVSSGVGCVGSHRRSVGSPGSSRPARATGAPLTPSALHRPPRCCAGEPGLPGAPAPPGAAAL
jgi:hypothetical protein